MPPSELKRETPTFNPRDRRWRTRLFARVPTSEGVRLHIFWRRLALAAVLLLVVAWLGLAGAFWGFARYRTGFREARFTDLALPWRWTQYRTSLGRFFLAEGRAAWSAGEARRAVSLLSAGLARSPGDLEARVFYADVLRVIGRPGRALEVLTAGLGVDNAARDAHYVRIVFGALFAVERYDSALALADTLLPATPDRDSVHRLVALQAAAAQYSLAHYGEAEALVRRWEIQSTPEGVLLLARCLWERGDPPAAVKFVETHLDLAPAREDLQLWLVRAYTFLGQHNRARGIALVRHLQHPDGAGARIDLIASYTQTGDASAAAREIEAFLRDFSADSAALPLLLAHAARISDPALVRRTLAAMRRIDAAPANAPLALAQAELGAGDPAAALRALAPATTGPLPPEIELSAAGVRAVAFAQSGQYADADAEIATFLAGTPFRVTEALALARLLRRPDTARQARRLIDAVLATSPASRAALCGAVELDLLTGDQAALAVHLPPLLRLAKPPRPLLLSALERLDPAASASLRDELVQTLPRAVPSLAP